MSPLELAGDILLIAGALFAFTGGVGLFRFPDFFTRTHAAGITDSAGAGLILLGLLMQADGAATAVRLLMIIVFLLLTSPTAAHALAQARLKESLKRVLASAKDR